MMLSPDLLVEIEFKSLINALLESAALVEARIGSRRGRAHNKITLAVKNPVRFIVTAT